jgi:tetratricopeptide (TPR) repeat protein
VSGPTEGDIRGLMALLSSGSLDKFIPEATRAVAAFPKTPMLHLLLGAGLVHQGDTKGALQSFENALALKPDYFDAQVNIGVIRQNQGRFAEAITWYRKALTLDPGHLTLLVNLGVTLREVGQFEESEVLLHRATLTNPQAVMALAQYAVTLRALGQPHADVLARILENPSQKASDIDTKMWAALLLDLPEKAFSFKPKGRNVLDYQQLPSLYRRTDLQSRLAALPALGGAMPHKNTKPLLYAGGDGVYAQRFARELIGSALEKCPGSDFHFHLMNLGNYKPEEALSIFPKERVTWSAEDMGACDKILFSPRRWLRLAQIQWHVERTIVLVDTDSVVNGDIFAALPDQFDVALYERPSDVFIQQMTMGGFLAVRPAGRDFTDFMAAHILHFEEMGVPKWFDDQFAMVVARDWFLRNVPSMTIKAVPPHMMDWSDPHLPQSLIWHAKGNQKHLEA